MRNVWDLGKHFCLGAEVFYTESKIFSKFSPNISIHVLVKKVVDVAFILID